MALWVKICGVTSVEDALAAVAAGADAVGVNLVSGSKRQIDTELAARIRDAVENAAEVIAVVADRTPSELSAIREKTRIDWLQFHGREAPGSLLPFLPRAFKAAAIATESDVGLAAKFEGERLLTDTKVDGASGGTGQRFDWALVRELATKRHLIVAGGLTPENVAEAVRVVRPFGVDVASGVEGSNPRTKDKGRMQRFVANARAALERV
jgi:phosphoribosylanthranilate isomerase